MSKTILAAMLSCAGTQLSDDEKYLFSAYNPLGISLFGRNLQTVEQVKKLIGEIKNVIGRDDVLIAVDQEGGRVSRLDSIKLPRYVSAEVLGGEAPEYTRYQALLIAENLHELGINVNYAPVVDKMEKPQSKVLESRCFSSDESVIVQLGSMLAETYIEQGICPCIKHLPGHFAALADPHLSVPKYLMNRIEIERYISYLRHLNRFPLAMTSHILLPAIDSQYPATQSKVVISELIRTFIGFDGFLLSDALDMHALSGTLGEKTCRALDAGVDAVCCCSGILSDLQAVCAQQRFLTEKARIRFAKIKKIIHNTPKYIELEDIRKRYNRQLEGKLNREYSYDATEVLHQMLKKGEN